MTYPVYYVIAEQSYGGPSELSMYGLPRTIVAVYECDLSDIDRIWKDEWYLQEVNGRRLHTAIYTREAASPFSAWPNRPVEQREQREQENSK